MYKHPLFFFDRHILKLGTGWTVPSFSSRSAPSRDSGWREMAVDGVIIEKMIEGRLKFPSSLNHASSAPGKTLAANGVRSHAWEFEDWVMLILQKQISKEKKKPTPPPKIVMI